MVLNLYVTDACAMMSSTRVVRAALPLSLWYAGKHGWAAQNAIHVVDTCLLFAVLEVHTWLRDPGNERHTMDIPGLGKLCSPETHVGHHPAHAEHASIVWWSLRLGRGWVSLSFWLGTIPPAAQAWGKLPRMSNCFRHVSTTTT